MIRTGVMGASYHYHHLTAWEKMVSSLTWDHSFRKPLVLCNYFFPHTLYTNTYENKCSCLVDPSFGTLNIWVPCVLGSYWHFDVGQEQINGIWREVVSRGRVLKGRLAQRNPWGWARQCVWPYLLMILSTTIHMNKNIIINCSQKHACRLILKLV